jgi:hypothetical protein
VVVPNSEIECELGGFDAKGVGAEIIEGAEYGTGPGEGKGSSHGSRAMARATGKAGYILSGGGFESIDICVSMN